MGRAEGDFLRYYLEWWGGAEGPVGVGVGGDEQAQQNQNTARALSYTINKPDRRGRVSERPTEKRRKIAAKSFGNAQIDRIG